MVLAVATGMWWFLLFSVSAPLSGWVAYLVEKKRFTRDSAQCRLDRNEALAEARTRLSRHEATQRHRIFSSPGLCLGFGTVFSDLTIDERLQDGIDHVDGRIVCTDMPIRIDPRTTTVTVSGTPAVLRTMAFAWLADRRFRWRPSPELTLLPELAGTEFSADHASNTVGSGSRPDSGIDDPISITLDEAAHPAVLTLAAPHAGSAVSLTVGSLAQARTTSSTAPGGPVPDGHLSPLSCRPRDSSLCTVAAPTIPAPTPGRTMGSASSATIRPGPSERGGGLPPGAGANRARSRR